MVGEEVKMENLNKLQRISESHPDAKRSFVGFQAQMNTSDSWPRNTVALLVGMSTTPSTSMDSL